jgi:ABC-type multidrug transport system ATPase subunit
MSTILEVNALRKTYGKITAVDQISFRVGKGEVFGILGPNGSGKTTTLGCIMGLLQADSGSFAWLGGQESTEARKRIGCLIETPNFYPYLSAWKNLEIVAKIKGCNESRIAVVLKETGLLERKDSAFKTFSLGMKQRLAIASALLADPEVLVLDEPTNGLDPQGITEIRELILRQQQAGKTIILASHLLNEVQKVCSDVIIMKRGKVLKAGPVATILTESDTAEVGSSNLEKLKSVLEQIPQVKSIHKTGKHFTVALEQGFEPEMLNQQLFEQGIVVNHLVRNTADLEQEFLKLIQAS